MCRPILGVVALVLVSVLPSASAWGGPGHNATARLAQSLFTPAASQLALDLLPDYAGRIDAISSWADQVRGSAGPYQWSEPFHYVNTPDFQCHYNATEDCIAQGRPDACVDGAVRNYTHRLLDSAIEDQQQYREALEFLVHFTGDLHQPLHAGFKSDSGGNGIRVIWPYSAYTTNLHSLWDSGMISRRVAVNFSNSYTQWDAHLRNLLDTTYKTEAEAWTKCSSGDDTNSRLQQYVPCSGEWVQESSTLCCQTVYVDEAGENMVPGTNYTLGDAYYLKNIDLLEMRIVQAGVRMAYVINTVARAVIPPSSLNHSSSSSGGDGGGSGSASPVSSSSSTGAEEAESSGVSTLDVVVAIIFVLLLITAVAFGYLYWRKRKYGLSSLFDSNSSGQSSAGRGMLLDEDESTPYTRT